MVTNIINGVNMYEKIFKDFYKEFDTKGLKRIGFFTKENKDGSKVLFEISTWDKGKTFDYSYIILDKNNNIVYDEADGEYKNKQMVLNIYNNINKIKTY